MMKPWNICGSKTGFYFKKKKSRAGEWEKNALSLWISHHRVRARRRLVWILVPSASREETKTNICFVVYCVLIRQRDETQIERRKTLQLKSRKRINPFLRGRFVILITAQFDYLRFNPFDYSKAEYSGNMRFFSSFFFSSKVLKAFVRWSLWHKLL